jgi:phosphatidate cytidylyltransferase
MARDSMFSRSNSENGPEDPAEGVRIIDPEQAAEVVERGEVVRRKRGEEPKYGDRPEPPPPEATPAIRFPLPGQADASQIERPKVAPVEPRTADAGEQPTLNVEPATGETELPHWTEPPTGEVPKVVLPEVDDDDGEQERWSSFASTGPRWRDENDDWGDAGDLSDLTDEGVGLGALDTSERPRQEEFLTFDDLDLPAPPMAAGPAPFDAGDDSDLGLGVPSVAAADRDAPIRIGRGDTRPAPPEPRRRPAPPPRGRRPRPDDGDDGGAGGRPPAGAGRDLPTAVIVGVAMAAAAVILFSIGPAATMILVELVVVLAGVELFNAFRRGGFRPATLLGLAAVAALPVAVYWRGEPALPLIIVLTFVFSMLWFILGVGGSARPIPNIGITLLGVVYVGVLGSFAALILDVPAEGVSILLVAVVAAVFYDVGGFFIGRRFGHRPLTGVSPNKTLEGLVGGIVASLAATFIAVVILGFGPFSLGQWLVFGVACALAGFLGDLSESLLKRDLGLKDMGSLLPEHGGVLDRFDGLLFVLPTAYYVVRALGIA